MTSSKPCKRDVLGTFNLAVDVSMTRWVSYLGTVIFDSTLIVRIYARPLLLAMHFYAVALYSIYLLFRKASIVDYPRTAIKGFHVLEKACYVFIPMVISELLP
jgi:hypothetical protein